MTKKLIAIRASDDTARQIVELKRWLGTTQTDVISKAIDRLYREELPGHPAEREATMEAQTLYDYRQNEGICSGEELGKFFLDQTGDPSPPGDTVISTPAALDFIAYCAASIERNNPGKFFRDA